MPADSNSSRGDWRIWDHGDPAVDQFWRKVLSRDNPVQRHASLGGAIPPEDARYVPPEFAPKQRFDPVWNDLVEAFYAS